MIIITDHKFSTDNFTIIPLPKICKQLQKLASYNSSTNQIQLITPIIPIDNLKKFQRISISQNFELLAQTNFN